MLYQHFTSDERDALQVMIDKDLDTATSFSNVSRTMAFSIVDCRRSEEILSTADLERGRLPETVPSGTVIGTVEKGVARALELRERVRVVAGGLAQACDILGADAASFGSVQNAMGTQEILAFTVPAGMLSPKSAGNSSRDGTRCAATCSPMPA
jgi:sugar (pentulose or hexulose) kinase